MISQMLKNSYRRKNIMSIKKKLRTELETYFEKLKVLSEPISLRSGMLINSPYEYLCSKKKLFMVGFNPGGVPDYSETTIIEDFNRHLEDLSFDAMEECWGSNQIKAPGCHPIQLLYHAFLNHTSLEKGDVLVTNLFWQRSPSSKDLIIDDKLEKICRDGFLLNIEIHQPETICFLGHETAKHVIDMGWSDICLLRGFSKYPWGENHKIKNYRMKFNGKSINTFSIPHPSRFGFGNSHQRLYSIINALIKNCGS